MGYLEKVIIYQVGWVRLTKIDQNLTPQSNMHSTKDPTNPTVNFKTLIFHIGIKYNETKVAETQENRRKLKKNIHYRKLQSFFVRYDPFFIGLA